MTNFETRPKLARETSLWSKVSIGSFGLGLVLVASMALAGPLPVVGGPLLPLVGTMPEGTWAKVSSNLFSDVWTPPELRPLNHLSNPTPASIILPWSGFGWDTRRGDLIIYGGGHANYSGNDVYRWHASSLLWERASLPSEITQIYTSNGYMAIDGTDAAPASAHTYDNDIYLPIIDRFLTLGGGLYNTGGPYIRADEVTPGAVRTTGPYLFDPDRANGNEVGGTTGSHVQRVAPHPEILGGRMWQNRDLTKNRPSDAKPTKYGMGCTAYAEENGADVVYIGATGGGGTNLDLFRYQITDAADPTTDSMSKVGRFWYGTAGQTSCAYDPFRKLFVRTGSNTVPFVFWNLEAPGPFNNDVRVDVNGSIGAFITWLNANSLQVSNCGMDFDPVDSSYALWCGGPEVWRLRAPPTNVSAGWTIAMDPLPGGPVPEVGWGTGILGKWKYVPGFAVFVGLQDAVAGNVWIYKPYGWMSPKAGTVNFSPQASLNAPIDGQIFDSGATLTLAATAVDSDGTVAKVKFQMMDREGNAVTLGSAASAPYGLAFTPPAAGVYALRAMAIDDRGGEGVSKTVTVTVGTPTTSSKTSLAWSSATSPPLAGAVTTLTASVSGSAPGGSVSFSDNGTPLWGCSGVALIGSGNLRSATCVTNALIAGGHTLGAAYAGDAMNSPSGATLSIVVSAPVDGTNYALAANGASATASSEWGPSFPASTIIDDRRSGSGWGVYAGWADGTKGSYPDWVQVNFNTSRTIDHVVVYSVQDDYLNPAEPTDTMTGSKFALTSFVVQAWNGSSWLTLASVNGNAHIKRIVSFASYTTNRIRVLVNSTQDGVWSRITEVEAWSQASTTWTDVALAANGSTASASSVWGPSFAPSGVIDNRRSGADWGNYAGWADATLGTFPDWLQIDFNGSKTIDHVVLYSVQDNYLNPVEPSDIMTGTRFVVTAFDVQGWNGSSWVTLASVTGNNLIKRTLWFNPYSTDRIRVLVDGTEDGVWSRVTEIEAWGF